MAKPKLQKGKIAMVQYHKDHDKDPCTLEGNVELNIVLSSKVDEFIKNDINRHFDRRKEEYEVLYNFNALKIVPKEIQYHIVNI